MLKRTVFVSLAALAISSPALAVEIPADADVAFAKESTAYPSTSFNTLLETTGAMLSPNMVADVPPSYANVAGGDVVFNEMDTAYRPMQYHTILTAYGFTIDPMKVSEMDIPSYAMVDGGEVVFADGPEMAYDGDEWTRILAAYDLERDDDHDGVLNDRDRCPNTPRGVKVNEDGCWLYSGVLFDFDKATLKPQYKAELRDAMDVFDQNPDLEVVVEGHTDAIGSDAYNQNLSERRANAVVRYLVDSVGVPASRLTSVGYGESRPVATNETAEGRSKNRRVEFTPNMR